MSVEFPSIDRVLPQSGPMRLLDRILEHDGESTTCAAVPASAALFRTDEGDVPAWVGIEYMAQCCAAHGALLLADGRRPPPALLMGARRIDFHADRLDLEGELVVVARPAVGSRKSVAFECSISEGRKRELLAQSRCVIYTPPEEHFGYGPLEAMSAGRPVVVADGGGPVETVVDGETGLVCEPTPEAFAAALVPLVCDSGLALKMGEAGRAHVARHFSLRGFRDQLHQMLEGLVTESAR